MTRILVIGGTGAQGFAVLQALLTAGYSIRVLSRNPDSPSVKAKFAPYPGVELFKGSFMDFEAVEAALQDCYGVYVNTDSPTPLLFRSSFWLKLRKGYSVNERDELFAGIRIFEIANTIPSLRHFVYSSIDYYYRLTNFNKRYGAHHTNGKGRVQTYLEGLPSPAHKDSQLAWTVYITGVYNEDLMGGPCVPVMEGDNVVFKLPLANGHLPLMTLKDCAAFAVHIFNNRDSWSGKTLVAASHFATGPEIAETLSRVSGVPARYEAVSVEEWVASLPYAKQPMATSDPDGISIGDNFAMWWAGFQDSVLLNKKTRDTDYLKTIHPVQSLEEWMRETNWRGKYRPVLKGLIDAGINAQQQQLREWPSN